MPDEIATENLRYEPITGEVYLKATGESLGYLGDGPDCPEHLLAEWVELAMKLREAERPTPTPTPAPTTLAGVLNAVTRDYCALRGEGRSPDEASRTIITRYSRPEIPRWQPMP